MSWLKDSLKGALGNLLYDVFKTWGLPLLTGYLIAPGYALLAKLGVVHWNWRILLGLFLLALIFNVFVGVKLITGRPVKFTEKEQRDLQQRAQDALTWGEMEKADSNAETISRRADEVDAAVTSNLPLVKLIDRVGLEATKENLGPLNFDLKHVVSVEQALIDEAYRIDRELKWPEYRKMGNAVVALNSSIEHYNKQIDEGWSQRLLREAEQIRKHIVIIQRERLQRSQKV